MNLEALASSQQGLVTREQALLFLTPSALRWRLGRGGWRVVHPGVYITHGGPLDWRARATAALLHYGPDAALILESAAYVGPGLPRVGRTVW